MMQRCFVLLTMVLLCAADTYPLITSSTKISKGQFSSFDFYIQQDFVVTAVTGSVSRHSGCLMGISYTVYLDGVTILDHDGSTTMQAYLYTSLTGGDHTLKIHTQGSGKSCDLYYNNVDITYFITDNTPIPTSPATPTPTSPVTPKPPSPVTPKPGPSGLCTNAVGANTMTITSCGNAACRDSVSYLMDTEVELCDPCVYGPLGGDVTIHWDGSVYILTDTAGNVVQEVCGVCHQTSKFSAVFECPAGVVPVPSGPTVGMCVETTDGHDTVVVSGCGDSTCSLKMKYPLDLPVQFCDPCTGDLGVVGTVTKSGSMVTISTYGGGLTQTFNCDTCVLFRDRYMVVSCDGGDEDGSNNILMIGLIAGGAALVVLIASILVFLYCRNQKENKDVELVDGGLLVQ